MDGPAYREAWRGEREAIRLGGGLVIGPPGTRAAARPGERVIELSFPGSRAATGVAFGFHDLRATCATGAGRLGAPPHVIALLLGHQGVPGTPHLTSRYDRADRMPEVRQALARWGEHVDELINRASRIPKAGTPPGTRGGFAVAS